MSEFHKKLQDLLQKPFRADAADLDFGIYRIINYRPDQLQTFIDEELPAIVDNILNARTVVEAAQQKVEDMTQEIRQTLGDNVIEISGHLINRASDKKTVVIIWRETKGWQKEDYERDYQFIYVKKQGFSSRIFLLIFNPKSTPRFVTVAGRYVIASGCYQVYRTR